MDGGTVAFIAIIMGCSLGITYVVMDFIHKMVKAKHQGNTEQSKELKLQIEKLVASNKNMKKRIETLEAIVVDSDADKLNTSFNSYINSDSEKENPVKESRSKEDLQL